MSVLSAKFQLSSWSRSGWKVSVGGGWGEGWFAQSFSCQSQPLCCVVLRLGFWQNLPFPPNVTFLNFTCCNLTCPVLTYPDLTCLDLFCPDQTCPSQLDLSLLDLSLLDLSQLDLSWFDLSWLDMSWTNLIQLNLSQRPSRHPSDLQQTPLRHPPDTHRTDSKFGHVCLQLWTGFWQYFPTETINAPVMSVSVCESKIDKTWSSVSNSSFLFVFN